MSDKLYEVAQSAQDKFFYGLVSVALGSLALSLQFSPKMGLVLWWALILSWVSLLISVFVGGWRLSRSTVFLRHSYNMLSANEPTKVELRKLMDKEQSLMLHLANAQIWSLTIGLIFATTFTIANYIHSVFYPTTLL